MKVIKTTKYLKFYDKQHTKNDFTAFKYGVINHINWLDIFVADYYLNPKMESLHKAHHDVNLVLLGMLVDLSMLTKHLCKVNVPIKHLMDIFTYVKTLIKPKTYHIMVEVKNKTYHHPQQLLYDANLVIDTIISDYHLVDFAKHHQPIKPF